MIFDEKRLGYGVENPLIKKGAKGYFSDCLKDLVFTVEKDCEMEWHTRYGELQNDPEISLMGAYSDNEGLYWQFFYVVEEAPSLQPLTDHELMELLGEKVVCKDGKPYVVKKFEKTPNEAGELLLIRCRLNGFVWVTAEELLEGYTFENGEPIGKEKSNEQVR